VTVSPRQELPVWPVRWFVHRLPGCVRCHLSIIAATAGPVQNPTKFYLVINLNAAEILEITVPQPLVDPAECQYFHASLQAGEEAAALLEVGRGQEASNHKPEQSNRNEHSHTR
jgi:hypothetical protein